MEAERSKGKLKNEEWKKKSKDLKKHSMEIEVCEMENSCNSLADLVSVTKIKWIKTQLIFSESTVMITTFL